MYHLEFYKNVQIPTTKPLKGKDASSDVLMSSNLNEMIVQPTKDAYFQISEKYESDTKGNIIHSQNNL